MTTPDITERVVEVWDGKLRLRLRVAGAGPALVYFHPETGLIWDPFLTRLAEHHTIYAPEFPGTSPSDPYAIHQVDELWDLVLIYEQALRELGLARPVAVAPSFGGMLAAELAAAYPDLFASLVLLAPLGLWRDDAAVANWITIPQDRLPELLFADPASEPARAWLMPPDDPEAAIAANAGLVWSLGCTGKFVWPLPEKGLTKRLHRVTAPTLIIWGEDDQLISPLYAEEFAQRITGAGTEIIPKAGHMPQVEQREATCALVEQFVRTAQR